MTPIMGLSYGVVQASWSQIVRSAITIFLGVAVAIVISFLFLVDYTMNMAW
jgi:hypothetical protein